MKTRAMLLVMLATAAMLISSTTAEAYLIAKMDGGGRAQIVASSIGYNWQPASGCARASHAEMKLLDSIYVPILPSGTPVSLLGHPEAWEEQWSVPLPAGATPQDVLKSIDDIWAAEKNWTSLKEDRVDSTDMSVWRFTDQTGKSWIATASAELSPTKSGHAFIKLRIVSASKLSCRGVLPWAPHVSATAGAPGGTPVQHGSHRNFH